jgi:hypothetical protein
MTKVRLQMALAAAMLLAGAGLSAQHAPSLYATGDTVTFYPCADGTRKVMATALPRDAQ